MTSTFWFGYNLHAAVLFSLHDSLPCPGLSIWLMDYPSDPKLAARLSDHVGDVLGILEVLGTFCELEYRSSCFMVQ